MENISFKDANKEIKKRVNEAVSSQTFELKENLIDIEDDILAVDPPLAVVMGNYFKVITSWIYRIYGITFFVYNYRVNFPK